MKQVTQQELVDSLQLGDIGVILAVNQFSTMQNWQRKKDKVPLRASHGFFMKDTPVIAESNGWEPRCATIYKDIGDKTQCWIFRHPAMTPDKFERMLCYWNGVVEGGGHYGIGSIAQMGLNFLGLQKHMTDAEGEFCSELTGHEILVAPLPYITELKPFEVTPSYQRSWFEGDGSDPRFYGKRVGWFKVAEYLGDRKYWIA